MIETKLATKEVPTTTRVPTTKVIEYWTCTIESHRHLTKHVADKCIAKCCAPKAPPTTEWAPNLQALVFLANANGQTIKQISKSFKIRPGYIAGKVNNLMRRLRYQGLGPIPADIFERNDLRKDRQFWVDRMMRYYDTGYFTEGADD